MAGFKTLNKEPDLWEFRRISQQQISKRSENQSGPLTLAQAVAAKFGVIVWCKSWVIMPSRHRRSGGGIWEPILPSSSLSLSAGSPNDRISKNRVLAVI